MERTLAETAPAEVAAEPSVALIRVLDKLAGQAVSTTLEQDEAPDVNQEITAFNSN